MSPTSYHCSTPRRVFSCLPRARLGGSQRPRLPWSNSIVLSGADVGHDRVRDGTGWVHVALGHEPPGRSRGRQGVAWDLTAQEGGSQKSFQEAVTSLGGTRLGVEMGVPSSAMSTAQLRSVARRPPAASQPGHLPGALLFFRDGDTRLGEGFPLRCFQRFARPDVATQRCRLPDNWHTSGPSSPVLSY